MKRSLYQFENFNKKMKIYCIYYGVNKRKSEILLFASDKKRIKYVHIRKNDILYKNGIYKCPIHDIRSICDIYDCDGNMIDIISNVTFSYIN